MFASMPPPLWAGLEPVYPWGEEGTKRHESRENLGNTFGEGDLRQRNQWIGISG